MSIVVSWCSCGQPQIGYGNQVGKFNLSDLERYCECWVATWGHHWEARQKGLDFNSDFNCYFFALAGASSSSSMDMSSLANTAYADHALVQLGKGAESCAGLQAAASAVVLESGGHCSWLTKRIASIGSFGRHPKNAERDLFRLLDLPIESWC